VRLWRLTIPRRLFLVAAPLASALLGAILVVILVKGVFGGEQHQPEAAVAPTATATARAWPPVTPVPPSEAPPARLVIPKIDVDAPLETKTVGTDGVMPMPSGPEVVAVYDMSEYQPTEEHRVGFGGNAILSGHVDYIHYGPAVFWNLSELKPGDDVEVRLDDGTVYHYAVVWNQKWPEEDIPWDSVFGINGDDAVTLLTCAGSWDGHNYSDRRAVRAERAYGPFPEQSG
jgi:LPXTG-site transpeptidase (sortase) family protein